MNQPSSWQYMRDPFCATGQSFIATLDTCMLRSEKGVEQLTDFLIAALSLGDGYIGVNGGFNPPYKYPGSRLHELGRTAPRKVASHREQERGSEHKCVWAYRTLKARGELEGAYVPKWFIDEGWLEIYEGAECAVRHLLEDRGQSPQTSVHGFVRALFI